MPIPSSQKSCASYCFHVTPWFSVINQEREGTGMMQTFLFILCLLKKYFLKFSLNKKNVQQCTHQRQMMTVQSHTFHVLLIIQMIHGSSPAGFTDIAFLEVVPTAWELVISSIKRKQKNTLGVSVLPSPC